MIIVWSITVVNIVAHSFYPTLNSANKKILLVFHKFIVIYFATNSFCVVTACLIESSFQITYHFFHWKKGTPFADDQGMYNRLTWWEQMDNGTQLTRNRKLLVVVPVVL
jgi:hypothetical protein